MPSQRLSENRLVFEGLEVGFAHFATVFDLHFSPERNRARRRITVVDPAETPGFPAEPQPQPLPARLGLGPLRIRLNIPELHRRACSSDSRASALVAASGTIAFPWASICNYPGRHHIDQAAKVVDNRFMTEIRLCWDPALDPERAAECAGPWLPLTNENVDTLEALVVAGADGYGDETHWLETR